MPTPAGPTTKRPDNKSATNGTGGKPADPADHEILFQEYFKSVGPRTYAAQVKKANNGNHYLVLTEGKRDDKTGEVRKCRVFVYSEDFPAFFRLIKSAAEFVKAHPVPDEVRKKRERFWAKNNGGNPPARDGANKPGATRETVARDPDSESTPAAPGPPRAAQR